MWYRWVGTWKICGIQTSGYQLILGQKLGNSLSECPKNFTPLPLVGVPKIFLDPKVEWRERVGGVIHFHPPGMEFWPRLGNMHFKAWEVDGRRFRGERISAAIPRHFSDSRGRLTFWQSSMGRKMGGNEKAWDIGAGGEGMERLREGSVLQLGRWFFGAGPQTGTGDWQIGMDVGCRSIPQFSNVDIVPNMGNLQQSRPDVLDSDSSCCSRHRKLSVTHSFQFNER